MQTILKTSATQSQSHKSAWRATALATAFGVLFGFSHLDAQALALGRITALSSLGEPLAAGIEIPEINAEEAASLKATLASPEAFLAAGMEYNPAFTNIQITLTKRANGSSYLLVRSDKVITDPFLNLVVNANWSNGRIVRNYTLLLDPPAAKQAESAKVTAPLTTLAAPSAPAVKPAIPPSAPPAPPAIVSVSPPTAATNTTTVAATTKAIVQKSPPAQTAKASNTGEKIKVVTGDTAGNIAANNLPTNVSLDQMLIALLRGNPQAFIDNNVNRLKAGAILDLPSEAEASAVSADEARRAVIGQSKDFNSFRRKLAENAPSMVAKSNDRAVSGKIEAKVDDKKVAAVTPDKLTLSKASTKADDKVGAGASKDSAKDNLDKIAKDRQVKEDATRTAEMAKNISELNKLAGTATAKTATTAASTSPSTPASPTTPAVTAPAAALATVAPAVGAPPAVTPAPVVPPAPATAAKPIVKAPIVVPVAEPSAIDFLTEDPIVLPAAGGLLALLLVGGLYSINKRKKRKAAQDAEDALLEEQFEEKSFFKQTTYKQIMEINKVTPTAALESQTAIFTDKSDFTSATETATAASVGSASIADPLTKADVYLNYGRDVQAEEILLEALKTQPNNATIYTKLLGIYSTRRDAKSFEKYASKAKPLFADNAPQWAMISQKGFELEPTNTLYAESTPEVSDSFAWMTSSEFSTRTAAQLDSETAKSPASVDLELDFDFVASSFPTSRQPEAPKSPFVDLPDFNLAPVAAAATVTAAAATKTAEKSAALEFDMGGLSLDLNETTRAASNNTKLTPSDSPMETKLALAHEFRSIGDNVGAKMLINEVIANATGPLKQKAENLLAEMG